MRFVKGLYGVHNRVTALALVMCLVGGSMNLTAWTMEKNEEAAAITPISPLRYLPAWEKGIPSTYDSKVAKEDWDNMVKTLKELSIASSPHPGTRSAEVLDAFFSFYQSLENNYQKTVKNLRKNKLLRPLFWGVVGLEPFLSNNPKVCIQIVQKIWTAYLKAYQDITKEELGFFGSLGYAAEHEKSYKHLYYTRDVNGFLVFTIHPYDQVNGSLYQTYIPYGEINKDLFSQREILFHLLKDGKTVEVEKASGLIINQTPGKILTVVPYIGAEGVVPYSIPLGLMFRKRWHESNPDLVLKERLLRALGASEETLSSVINEAFPDDHLKKTIEIPSCPAKLNHQFGPMEDLLVKFLADKRGKFVARPFSDVEHRETEFVFLLNLQEKLQETPEDEGTLLLLGAIKEDYGNSSLEEIIAGYEANLLEEYADQEEAKIRAEQEERRKMVSNNEYDMLRGKKPKNNKKKGTNRKRAPNHRIEPEKSNGEDVKEKARIHASNRINSLKEKEIRKPMKYDEYLEMINVAVQELRQKGIPIKGALNGSSHGSITVGETNVPIYRPHGRHNTVHIKSARRTLDNLLDNLLKAYSSETRCKLEG